MSLEICEEIWLKKILSDLHQDCVLSMKIYGDNKVAISNNLVQHDRTKHAKIIKEPLSWFFISVVGFST